LRVALASRTDVKEKLDEDVKEFFAVRYLREVEVYSSIFLMRTASGWWTSWLRPRSRAKRRP
jgi:hypothetical protein